MNGQAVRRFPVEAETRLQQAAAVKGRGVGITVAIDEVGVQGRHVARRIEVVAKASRKGEPDLVEINRILSEDGVGRKLEVCSAVIRIVGANRVAVENIVDQANLEIVDVFVCVRVADAVKAIFAFRVLNEQVEHFDLLALEAEGEQVVVEGVVALDLEVERLGVELVRVTRVIGAEIDGGVLTIVARADLDFAEIRAADRVLTGVVRRVGRAHFGREIVGPVGEQLTGVRVQQRRAVIEVVEELIFRRAGV